MVSLWETIKRFALACLCKKGIPRSRASPLHGKPKGYNQVLLFFSLHEELLRIGQRLVQIFLVLFEKSSMFFVSLIFLVFVFVFFLRRRDTCSVLSMLSQAEHTSRDTKIFDFKRSLCVSFYKAYSKKKPQKRRVLFLRSKNKRKRKFYNLLGSSLFFCMHLFLKEYMC